MADDPATMDTRLVLWDLDNTLIKSAGLSRYIWEISFQHVFGIQPDMNVPVAGRTDLAIIKDLLVKYRLADPGHLAEFRSGIAAMVEAEGPTLGPRFGEVLPGAEGALRCIAGMPDVISSLLTGNLRVLAEAKLEAAHLTSYLDMDVAAFGDDHEVRASLIDISRRQVAIKYGLDLSGRRTVVVGDTPLDIEAARARDAIVVSVATGHYGPEDLSAADVILTDLRDTAQVIRAIMSGGQQ